MQNHCSSVVISFFCGATDNIQICLCFLCCISSASGQYYYIHSQKRVEVLHEGVVFYPSYSCAWHVLFIHTVLLHAPWSCKYLVNTPLKYYRHVSGPLNILVLLWFCSFLVDWSGTRACQPSVNHETLFRWTQTMQRRGQRSCFKYLGVFFVCRMY